MPGDRRWFERHFRVTRDRVPRFPPREQYRCTKCEGYYWEDYRHRCSHCNRYRDLYAKAKAETQNEAGICVCGTKHTAKANRPYCLCSCECKDPDERGDPNYEEGSDDEPEDDIETEFAGRAKEAEEPFARKHGFRTAGWFDEGKKSQRPLFYESLGHRTVAHMHDIGIPEESSLANSDNIITSIEANNLFKGLEPWEFEAVQQCSGEDHKELLRKFPEAKHFQFSDPESVRVQPTPRYYCNNCHRLFTSETMERLSRRIMVICEECCMVQRPANPVDDPDWWQFNPSINGTMEHCHCRCRCSPEDVIMTSPAETVEPNSSDAARQGQEQLRQNTEDRTRALGEGIEQSRQRQEELLQRLESQVTQLQETIARQARAMFEGQVEREVGVPRLEALRQHNRDLQAFIQRERDQQRTANAVPSSAPRPSPATTPTPVTQRRGRYRLIVNTSVPRASPELESATPSPIQIETAIRAYADNINRQRTPTEEEQAGRERLRRQLGLPEMRFSNLEDPARRVEELVDFALEDAQVAHSMEEPDEARQYATVGRQLGLLGGMASDHWLIVEAERHIAELDAIIAENEAADANEV